MTEQAVPSPSSLFIVFPGSNIFSNNEIKETSNDIIAGNGRERFIGIGMAAIPKSLK